MSFAWRLLGACLATGCIGGVGFFLQTMAAENLRAATLLEQEGVRIPARLSSDLKIEAGRWTGNRATQFYEFQLNGVEYRGRRTRLKSEFLNDPYVLYLPSDPRLHTDTTLSFRNRADTAQKASFVVFVLAAVVSGAILIWPRKP